MVQFTLGGNLKWLYKLVEFHLCSLGINVVRSFLCWLLQNFFLSDFVGIDPFMFHVCDRVYIYPEAIGSGLQIG